MQRRLLYLTACLVMAVAFPSIASAATVPDDVLKATLGNGLRVVIVHNALAPVVSTDLAYLVGSRDDPSNFPGMAHAQEHMMFRGTPNLNTSQLGTIATALGGDFNAETSDTLTQFEFTVPAANLDAILRIESDRMRDILDAQSQWEQERGAIEQEVIRDDTSPGGDFFRDVQAFAFSGTPYARQGVGTVPAFNRLTGPDLKRFYERWYAPNNAVFVIAGNVDKDAVLREVRSYFEAIPRRNVPEHDNGALKQLERTVIRRPTTLTYPLAAVGFRFPGIESPDFLASYLLQQVLAARRGPLQALVDSGEALDAEFVSSPYNPVGQLGMATAALGPGADAYAMTNKLSLILRGYAEHGVPAELFESTKRQTIVDQELSRNSVSALANDWATTIALDGEPSIQREQELLAGVTLADVNRVAKRYLDTNHAIVGALTPSANASQNAPPQLPPRGPEKPLDVQGAATQLPAWGQALLDNVAAPPADDATTTRTQLPNGVTLVVRPSSISDTVLAIGSIRTNAAVQEPPGQEGVASVLDAMFAYGTQERDRQTFARLQDDIDTQLGGGASFGMQTTSASFERAVPLLAEAELHPRFDQQTFDAARRRVTEELETALSGTSTQAQIQTDRKLLPEGDPDLRQATPQTLQLLTLADVRAYYAKAFRPDLTSIVIVGSISPDAAVAAFTRAFSGWHASGPQPNLELPALPLNGPGDVRVQAPGLGQDSVTLTQLVSVNRGSPQNAAMRLGNTVFGGGALGPEQSRLFRDIRQNSGLVYSIGSEYAGGKTRSRFTIDFSSSPETRERIVHLIDQEITRMQTELVGGFELSLAKAATVRRTIVDASSLGAIGQALLGNVQQGNPFDQERVEAQAIIATSAAAVKSAFASYVRPNDFVNVLVGP